ncbi:hypothetical protein ACQW02_10975 [Humitalea sp. 24SJ18S-53]|uniref:hypothetical protein n=1 Tax=Humitalea sp. 24SJ18S-53 TaxID=3422307 RepID=UPI003D6719F2
MLNGSQVLASVDERLAAAEREARGQQAEADALTTRLDTLRIEEADALRALAGLRVAQLQDSGGAIQRLDAAEAQAAKILAARKSRLAESEAALSGVRADRDAAIAARDEAEDRGQKAAARDQAARAAARAALASDPEWVRLRDAAKAADAVAERARQKAGFAKQDLATKGEPYLADPLFAYLWNRGYGTTRYSAFPLVRMIDGWVAKIAKFEPARRDYAMLTDLPVQLEAHAERMEAAADVADTSLDAYERRVAGLPDAAPAPTTDSALQAEVERAQTAFDLAEAAHRALAGGDDDATRNATAALTSALAQEPLRALREAALRTPTRDDDAIIERLDRVHAERREVEHRLPQERAEADEAWRRLEDLRALRQEARQRGVQGGGFDMATGAVIGGLLTQVLTGALSRGGFFDRLGERQLPPGPWGQPSQDGPWSQSRGKRRKPSGDSPWGGGGFGGGGKGSGGFGGGGFSTGGGMGGGGFQKGGGF